jgi:urease accessory protein
MALPSLAYAHAGGGHVHGLIDGLHHPVSGLDHLAAMIAVGLWAAQRGGQAIWQLPLTFVFAMVVGGAVSMTSAELPLVEPAIVASVIVFGLIVAMAAKLPLAAAAALVAAGAFVHGYAHTVEMSRNSSVLGYALGFVVATIALHLVGIAVGLCARKSAAANALRYAGGAIALCGIWMCLA